MVGYHFTGPHNFCWKILEGLELHWDFIQGEAAILWELHANQKELHASASSFIHTNQIHILPGNKTASFR